MNVLSVCVCVQHVCTHLILRVVKRGCQIPWSWGYGPPGRLSAKAAMPLTGESDLSPVKELFHLRYNLGEPSVSGQWAPETRDMSDKN